MNRQRVDQFVRQDDSGDRWCRGLDEQRSKTGVGQSVFELFVSWLAALDRPVLQPSEKRWGRAIEFGEDREGECPRTRAVLDERERLWFPERFPQLPELVGHDPAEDGVRFRCRQVVTGSAGSESGRVVAVFGVVERQFHVPGERDRPGARDFAADPFHQFLAHAHVLRSYRSVPRPATPAGDAAP